MALADPWKNLREAEYDRYVADAAKNREAKLDADKEIAQMRFGVGDFAGRTFEDRALEEKKRQFDIAFPQNERIAQMQFGGLEDFRKAQAGGMNLESDLLRKFAPYAEQEKQYGVQRSYLDTASKWNDYKNRYFPDKTDFTNTSLIPDKPDAAVKPNYASWYKEGITAGAKPGQFTNPFTEMDIENNKWQPFGADYDVSNWLARRSRNIAESPRRLLNEIAQPIRELYIWKR